MLEHFEKPDVAGGCGLMGIAAIALTIILIGIGLAYVLA